MKFTKKSFQEKYKPKEVEELYDPNKGEIGGDTVTTTNQIGVNIQPIPGDSTSNYVQGIATDSETKAKNAFNTGTDIVISRFNMGTPYGYVSEEDENLEEDKKKKKKKKLTDKQKKHIDLYPDGEINKKDFEIMHKLKMFNKKEIDENLEESAKEKMENIIKELLNSKNDEGGFVKNDIYSDVNRNKIPDIEELKDIKISNLVSDFIKTLQDKEGDEISIVINDLILKLSDSIPTDYKNIIKNNF